MNYLIANWKQNKTLSEFKEWVDAFFTSDLIIPENLVFIISPNYLLLPEFHNYLKELDREDIFLASQDVSQYEDGKHTGLVSAKQVSEFASFSIIGHSEKRSDGDSLEVVNKKIRLAIKNGLTPIVCFSDISQYKNISDNFDVKDLVFAYEPISAIGTGKPEDPKLVEEVINKTKLSRVLYGGSVDVDNIDNYLKMGTVTGFLVGTASLDPLKLKALVNKFH